MSDPPIVAVIKHYFPEWEPPKKGIYPWTKCLCPFHGDENPSAAVSYDREAFNCLACGVKGDAISIIRHEEEVTFAEAKRIAEEVLAGSDISLPPELPRQSSRRLYGESGAGESADQRRDGEVQAGVRGRTTPWT